MVGSEAAFTETDRKLDCRFSWRFAYEVEDRAYAAFAGAGITQRDNLSYVVPWLGHDPRIRGTVFGEVSLGLEPDVVS